MSTTDYIAGTPSVEREFLTRLYGKMPRDQWINVVTSDNWAGRWYRVDDLDSVASYAGVHQACEGIYIRITTATNPPEKGRGTAEHSTYVPAFWSDIDLASDAHKTKGELPETVEDAKTILQVAGLPDPNMWVHSGNGVYPYWVFDERVLATDEIARLSQALHAKIESAAKEIGMEVKPMADLARVLRLPGTVNRKNGAAKPCRIIEDDGGYTSLESIREVVQDFLPKAAVQKTSTPTSLTPSDFLANLPEGDMCPAMQRSLDKWSAKLAEASNGGRHPEACRAVMGVLSVANFGHEGVETALDELRSVFDMIKPPAEQARGEWESIVDTAAAKMEERELRSCCGDTAFTDAHMSVRFAVEQLEGDYIWSKGTGWMMWSGVIWEKVDETILINLVKRWTLDNFQAANRLFVKIMQDDGASERAKALVDAWRLYLTKNKMEAVVALARGEVLFDPSEMDANPDLLNCPNGVVDLRTGELLAHDPARLMSKITTADYNPNAESKAFDKILTAIQPDHLDWFQVKVGNGISGHPQIGNDPNVVMQGGGMNAKTSCVDALGTAVGSYKGTVGAEILTGDKGRTIHDNMDLWGVRLAITEELPEDGRINTKALKDITDTAIMQGRYLYENKISWRPTHTLFITTNIIPQVKETTHGAWRRLALMKFPYTYVSEDRPLGPKERKADPTLRIRVEQGDREILEAALRWAVDGAKRYYELDRVVPQPPESIGQATREWRKQADFILAYWDSGRIEADPESCVLTEDLHRDFSEWRSDRGDSPMSAKMFTPNFEAHQETQSNRVERTKLRLKGMRVSRPNGATGATPDQARVWKGVRFVEGASQAAGGASSASDEDPWQD